VHDAEIPAPASLTSGDPGGLLQFRADGDQKRPSEGEKGRLSEFSKNPVASVANQPLIATYDTCDKERVCRLSHIVTSMYQGL